MQPLEQVQDRRCLPSLPVAFCGVVVMAVASIAAAAVPPLTLLAFAMLFRHLQSTVRPHDSGDISYVVFIHTVILLNVLSIIYSFTKLVLLALGPGFSTWELAVLLALAIGPLALRQVRDALGGLVIFAIKAIELRMVAVPLGYASGLFEIVAGGAWIVNIFWFAGTLASSVVFAVLTITAFKAADSVAMTLYVYIFLLSLFSFTVMFSRLITYWGKNRSLQPPLVRDIPFESPASLTGAERIAHLSDLHIPEGSRLTEKEEWRPDSLARCISVLETGDQDERFAAVVFSGDVTDTGHEKAWQIFRDTFSDYESRIVLAPGNHDLNVIGYGAASIFLVADQKHGEGRRVRMERFMSAAADIMGGRACVWFEGEVTSLADAWNVVKKQGDTVEAASRLFPFFVSVPDSQMVYVVWNTVRSSTLAFNNSLGAIDKDQLENFSKMMHSNRYSNDHQRVVHIMHHKLGLPKSRLTRVKRVKHTCRAWEWFLRIAQSVVSHFQIAGMVLPNAGAIAQELLTYHPAAVVLHGHHHTSFHGEILYKSGKLDVVSAPSTTLGAEFYNGTGSAAPGFDSVHIVATPQGSCLHAPPERLG